MLRVVLFICTACKNWLALCLSPSKDSAEEAGAGAGLGHEEHLELTLTTFRQYCSFVTTLPPCGCPCIIVCSVWGCACPLIVVVTVTYNLLYWTNHTLLLQQPLQLHSTVCAFQPITVLRKSSHNALFGFLAFNTPHVHQHFELDDFRAGSVP